MDMATERVIGMRIKYLVLNMTAVMLLISGCAQPEINSTSNTSAVTEIQNQSYDVAQEQGRHIEKDLKMKDSDIKVNAQVIVTADQVQQGKLELVNPSLKEIENLFEIKYPLEKTDNGYESFTENNYQGFHVDEDNSFYYENSYVSTGHLDAETIGSENFTDQEQDVMDQYAESASECLEALGASVEIQSQDLEKSGEYYTGEIMYYETIEGVPLIESINGQKALMETHIEMTSLGVETLQMNGGLWQVKEADPVNVLSVDQLLEIVSKAAEEGTISVWPDTEIDKIQLVYYLDSGSGDFYPVWCLIQDIDGMEQIEVCVHAVTGDVVY